MMLNSLSLVRTQSGTYNKNLLTKMSYRLDFLSVCEAIVLKESKVTHTHSPILFCFVNQWNCYLFLICPVGDRAVSLSRVVALVNLITG